MYSKPKCSSYDELDSLIEQVKNKADKEFDSLVSTLNINKEQNKQWAEAYYSLVKETKKLAKSIRRLKVWKWILIIFLIFPFFLMNNAQKKKEPILAQKTKELNQAQANLNKQLGEFRKLLSYEFAYDKIISQVWPDAKLDLFNKQAGDWEHDYFQYMPKDSCATSLISGTLFDHPFVLMNRKDQTWHPHIYTGSIPVTYAVNVNGKMETRTEIVVATVTLPEPGWGYIPYFLYRTSKPEGLSFCNDMSARSLKKQTKKGGMQKMDNPEFDKIFPASRNNEVEYRVVFTPLAQDGFVKLFKHNQFRIEKEKEVTSVITGTTLIDNDFSDDTNYDLTEWKKQYCAWVARLVKHVGLFSLPIANMPVYYQMDYKPHAKANACRIQAQSNADWVCRTYGIYDSFETDTIFEPMTKTHLSVGKTDVICHTIKCKYFHPHHRVEMVPRPSRNGVVVVPVPVIDYLPRSKQLYIYESTNLKKTNIELVAEGYAIHSGQYITWSWKPINSTVLHKHLELLNK